MRRMVPMRLLARLKRLPGDRRATVMIEMAACIPFLAVVGLGGLEIANLTLTHSRISQIGLSAADNASRMASGSSLSLLPVSEADIYDVFLGAEHQAGGLDIEANGRIILSSLEQNDDGGQWLRWQRCYGALDVTSSYGVAGDGASGTSFAGMGDEGEEVTAPPKSAVMFVEIVYTYQPLAFGNWLGERTIRTKAAFNVRETRDLRSVSASAGVPDMTCPAPAAPRAVT